MEKAKISPFSLLHDSKPTIRSCPVLQQHAGDIAACMCRCVRRELHARCLICLKVGGNLSFVLWHPLGTGKAIWHSAQHSVRGVRHRSIYGLFLKLRNMGELQICI